jgi:hypothetical protein
MEQIGVLVTQSYIHSRSEYLNLMALIVEHDAAIAYYVPCFERDCHDCWIEGDRGLRKWSQLRICSYYNDHSFYVGCTMASHSHLWVFCALLGD